MNTVVKNWQIVKVFDCGKLIGKVLRGTCVNDMTCRFFKGDFICTSSIEKVYSSPTRLKTASGSLYHVIGTGASSEIDYKDFELLRNGFSPEQIAQLNTNLKDWLH